MAVLDRMGGLDALLVMTSAALATLLAWLYHRLVSAGIVRRWALLVTALAALASSHHFHVRPHILSMILFACLYSRLIDFEARRIGVAGLMPLVPLCVLWSNSHGAVVGGLATFGLAIGGWAASWAAGRRSPMDSWRGAAMLLAILSLCTAGILANPYGLEMPRTWSAILRSPGLPRLIVEHASLVRTRSWQVLVLAALYVGAILGTRPRCPRITSLLPLVWLALAFGRIRHAPFFAIGATLALADLLPEARWLAWLSRRGIEMLRGAATMEASGRFPRMPFFTAAAVLAAVSLFHLCSPARRPLIAKLDPQVWPVQVLPELRSRAGELPPGSPILNDLHFGGFIAYYLPSLRISVDDRWELYGDDFMVAAIEGDAGWLERLATRCDVPLALAQPGSPLERYLERGAGWHMIASSRTAVLYERDRRRPDGNRPNARASGCPLAGAPILH